MPRAEGCHLNPAPRHFKLVITGQDEAVQVHEGQDAAPLVRTARSPAHTANEAEP